jgi:hypothetical protein
MKGTVLRSQWPAAANNKAGSKARSTENPDAMSRITLALLDEYAMDTGRKGYDPYNTNTGKRSNLWHCKPKRD